MTRNPVVVKEDTEIKEVIDIILEKAIILVPVINDQQRLVGVVSRLDILRQNLSEKFVTIGGTSPWASVIKSLVLAHRTAGYVRAPSRQGLS